MRLYVFGNYYLSSIQQGIQAAHVVAEMFMAYDHNTPEYSKIVEWAANHKTIICLNGGNCGELLTDVERISAAAGNLDLPWTAFHEDADSLNSAITAIGVIVPECLYKMESAYGSPCRVYSSDELELMQLITNSSLAK